MNRCPSSSRIVCRIVLLISDKELKSNVSRSSFSFRSLFSSHQPHFKARLKVFKERKEKKRENKKKKAPHVYSKATGTPFFLQLGSQLYQVKPNPSLIAGPGKGLFELLYTRFRSLTRHLIIRLLFLLAIFITFNHHSFGLRLHFFSSFTPFSRFKFR